MSALPAAGVPVAQGVAVPEVLITAESQSAAPRPDGVQVHLANVDAEATAIQAAFGGAANAEVQRNISVSDFVRLIAGRTTWCFPGHGDAMLQSEPTLAFVGVGGAIEVVSIDTLVDIVRPHVLTGKLELIVLTGCCTARLAAALRERAFVPYVLCWETVLNDEAGRIFGTAFAQEIAKGAEPPAALEKARTAVCTETEPGKLDTGLDSRVQKFELDINPKDVNLVHPMNPPGKPRTIHDGRLRHHPGAQRGRLAAGTPKLFRFESTTLHDVPPLPAHYMPRPEQWDLRAALVNGVRGDNTVVGIVGASPVTGIAGTAGLGKTTTANWLALDPCVRSAFRDGVFWLEFGKERTAMQRLVRLAELLGVPLEDLDRLERRGLDSLRDEVARRLKDRCCLIILDDVWDEEQPKPFQQLAGGRVTVLMTTRKSSIVEAFGQQLARLELRPMEDEAATRLMVHCSGKAEDDLHGPSLAKLAKMCAGVPAMLRSVGSMCNKRSAEGVVKWFEDHKLRHRMPTSMARADGYQQDAAKGNLFLAYEGQLEFLAETDEELATRCTMCAVFPEDTEVPLEILSDLWSTDEAETREVVERLGGEHLVELVDDGARIRLLDPVRDYLRCRGKSALEGWHAQLLGACRVSNVGYKSHGYWEGRDGGHRFMHHLNGCKGKLGVGSLGAIKGLYLDEVGDAGAASLALALEKNATLQTLELGCGSMGDAGMSSLALVLAKNATLQTLELRGKKRRRCESSVGVAGVASLASALAKNAALETLDLLNIYMGDEGAASLALALETNATLQKLSLREDNMGDAGAASLASALAKNATLQTLILRHNNMGDAGAASLASALAKNATLQTLILRHNNMGDAGAASLASALAKNATLQTLELGNNSMGDVGAASLASALERNATLQTINVIFSKVSDSGAASFASALENNVTLSVLNLHGNSVGDAGAASLASALEKNATLQRLKLGVNAVGVAGAVSLTSALEKNTTLQKCEIGICNFPTDSAAAADAALVQLALALGRNSAATCISSVGLGPETSFKLNEDLLRAVRGI